MNSKQKREAKKAEKQAIETQGEAIPETIAIETQAIEYPTILAENEGEAKEQAKKQGLSKFTFGGIRYSIELRKASPKETIKLSADEIYQQNLALSKATAEALGENVSIRGMHKQEIAMYHAVCLFVQEKKTHHFNENDIVSFLGELTNEEKAIRKAYAYSMSGNCFHMRLHRISSAPKVGIGSAKNVKTDKEGKRINSLVSNQMIVRNGQISLRPENEGFYTLRTDLKHPQVVRDTVREEFQKAFATQLGHKF